MIAIRSLFIDFFQCVVDKAAVIAIRANYLTAYNIALGIDNYRGWHITAFQRRGQFRSRKQVDIAG